MIRLRALAAGFATANPALAQLLGGPMGDPDVERILDGVVFQNDLLARKLKEDFPELVCTLTQLILPHYLRPLPACTIIGFTPDPAMGRSIRISAGTQLASIPVDGVRCSFRTSSDLEVQPLAVVDAACRRPSERTAEIILSFRLLGLTLSQWRPGPLRLFLAGDRVTACELYKLISLRLNRIVLSAPGGVAVNLPPGSLKPVGFEESDALVPYPSHAFPGYRLLQEYFHTPDKFLFFELDGFDRWRERGDGGQFAICFQLEGIAAELPKIGPGTFVPNAVPAVNLFTHEADPIVIDHRSSRYLVRPCGQVPSCNRVFSVNRVTGFTRATGRERSYEAFELFGSHPSQKPVYQVGWEWSRPQGGDNAYLSVVFPAGTALPHGETLSLELTCTNGHLPDSLRLGDIRIPEPGMPETIAFSNITPVHPGVSPPLGPELLWRLTTHLYLNHVTLASAGHLRTLLSLYLFQDNTSGGPLTANRRRINGIEEVALTRGESLRSGVPLRGSHMQLNIRQDHFAGEGDLFLFGCILDRFLAEYAALNCYTRLTLHETIRGESCQWPLRRA